MELSDEQLHILDAAQQARVDNGQHRYWQTYALMRIASALEQIEEALVTREEQS